VHNISAQRLWLSHPDKSVKRAATKQSEFTPAQMTYLMGVSPVAVCGVSDNP